MKMLAMKLRIGAPLHLEPGFPEAFAKVDAAITHTLYECTHRGLTKFTSNGTRLRKKP